MIGKSNSSYITYLHNNLFQHLGHQDKADARPGSGDSDSSVEPVKKRRPPAVRRKGEMCTFLFCVSVVEQYFDRA